MPRAARFPHAVAITYRLRRARDPDPAWPADEVTRIGAEDDPCAAGLGPDDVDAIWRAAVARYRTGLYPALACACGAAAGSR